jgi:hypothetical protein
MRSVLSLFGFSILVSCVAHDTRSGSTPPLQSSGSDSVATKPAVIPPKVAAGPDTMTPHLIPRRNKHDSAAFSSTVAFGRRQLMKWPVPPTPLPGSILPAKRIVAFYGNPLSKRMGVLGEYPPEAMLAKLDTIVREWQEADPTTPVQPALHLIAVVAQGSAGRDGLSSPRVRPGRTACGARGWTRR